MARMLSAVMEDYIKAIYAIGSDGEERVATSALADSLDVTAPTVSSMLTKLEDRGLVDREEYRGVTLTEEGEIVALEILRHHRLLEAFLTEQLDYDWADVHEEADRLEHHVSDELATRIAEALDNPGVDPHGDPIPDADLSLPEGDEELRYLANAGIRPGVEVGVVDIAPFGMVTVETAAGEQSLPEGIAGLIEVVPAAAADGAEA